MAVLRFSPDVGPVSNLLTLQSELERFLRNPSYGLGLSSSGAFPHVNVFEDGDGVAVIAEVPGLDPASLNISGQGHTLNIKGERKREAADNAAGYHRRERPFGEFARSIQLPQDLDLGKSAATYEAGMLTIKIPKAEAAKPRQISVKSA